MSDDSRAIVPVGQRGVVASVSRQIAITGKLLGRILSVQNLLDVFNVPQDGSIEDAIIRIRPGGLISIAAGRYILDAGVTITKPLRIKGAGCGATIIESSVKGAILSVETDGLFAMENVGILKTGEHPGDLLSISVREVILKSCALTGNRIQGEVDEAWGGIRVSDCTSGLVENTSVTRCWHGIIVEGSSKINLHCNCCEGNEHSGILFDDSSSIGLAENNICSRNEGCGIMVFGPSKVNLIGNFCEGNGWNGIAFFGSVIGTAENNICSRNEAHGIGVADQSEANLIGNLCEENKSSGIWFSDSSTGTAEKNQCVGNDGGSIFVAPSASAILKNNH